MPPVVVELQVLRGRDSRRHDGRGAEQDEPEKSRRHAPIL